MMLYFTLLKKIFGNLEDNNDTDAVFLDLAKAFNSNAQEILLKNLKKINLSQPTILRLKSFLTNWSQSVKLGFNLSDKKNY